MRRQPTLDHYTRTASRAAKSVIDSYSTSFGTATALLNSRHRHHIRNVYAMARVADEIVDGLADEAGLNAHEQCVMLEDFIATTYRGVKTRVSSNLIIHAFAQTACETGIGRDLIEPFFVPMRTDLESAAANV